MEFYCIRIRIYFPNILLKICNICPFFLSSAIFCTFALLTKQHINSQQLKFLAIFISLIKYKELLAGIKNRNPFRLHPKSDVSNIMKYVL